MDPRTISISKSRKEMKKKNVSTQLKGKTSTASEAISRVTLNSSFEPNFLGKKRAPLFHSRNTIIISLVYEGVSRSDTQQFGLNGGNGCSCQETEARNVCARQSGAGPLGPLKTPGEKAGSAAGGFVVAAHSLM